MTTDNSAGRYWLCPLYSFDCDSKSVDFIDGIQIKPAPGKLVGNIQEQTYHLYGQWDDPSKFSWVVLLPYRAKATTGGSTELYKSAFDEQDRVEDLLFDLMTSLRLCNEGEVVAGPLEFGTIDNSEWHGGGHTVWTSISRRDFLDRESKYMLQQSDVPEVNKLLQNIRQLRDTDVLDTMSIALGRFNSSYHGNIEGRIIDQMIAFESLYIAKEQELAYKLALRTSFLLGGATNSIFNDMKKAYNYRSRIVHGDNPPSRDELRAIVPKTEEYLRQSIKKFLALLSKGMSLKQIRSKLDENILTNGRTLVQIE